jgi:GDP-L-fucose synthase
VNAFFDAEKPEYVFLAAARVGGIHANNTYRAEFIYENLMIQSNVIHAAYKYGVKKLLFLGSSCIYPKFCPQPMKEEYLLTGQLEPTNEPYAIAKIAGIKMCAAYNRQYGTNYLSVMPTNTYGPGDNYDLENSHVLPALIRKIHEAKMASQSSALSPQSSGVPSSVLSPQSSSLRPQSSSRDSQSSALSPQPSVSIWGSGNAKREFLYCDDLADACVFLMEKFNANETGEFVNIGVGLDATIREVAEIVAAVIGFTGKFDFDKSKPDGTPRKLLDVSRLSALGWKPKIGLREGIAKTYEAYLSRLSSAATQPMRAKDCS